VVDRDAVVRFARHLGVAYQILNDLNDWRADSGNKRRRGTDLLGGRPTVLWALANRQPDEPSRTRLAELADSLEDTESALDEAAELYTAAGVFDQAESLLEKHHRRAVEAIDSLTSEPLRALLDLLASAILDRPRSS
jgi:geranylgeranyl pyrophosphate synthase